MRDLYVASDATIDDSLFHLKDGDEFWAIDVGPDGVAYQHCLAYVRGCVLRNIPRLSVDELPDHDGAVIR